MAGRSLGPWVTAFSERAAGESAWLLLALPGAAIAIGLGEFWSVIGIIIGVVLGFTLDSFLDTSPIFLIILIFFGFAAGVRTMIKTAKEIDRNITE